MLLQDISHNTMLLKILLLCVDYKAASSGTYLKYYSSPADEILTEIQKVQ